MTDKAFPNEYGKKVCELYIHLPFCVKKCNYCDFFSGPSSYETRRKYVDLLIKEIEAFPEKTVPNEYLHMLFQANDKIKPEELTVDSVFFGGGTPSTLEPVLLSEIFTKLHEKFAFSEDCEITLEANPGTLSKEKLNEYKRLGINRLSLGLQVYDDALLKLLGRIHDTKAFENTFMLAREAGFDNINIDLISSLPTLSYRKWAETLEKTVLYRPEHISVYSLIIEEGTKFYELYSENAPFEKLLPTEDEDREMIGFSEDFLNKNGYRQYEISNYAREGYECRHNIGYWTGKTYFGLGASAASCFYMGENEYRFKHTESLDYLESGFKECEILGKEAQMEEFMILSLRMNRGAQENEFRNRFGVSMFEKYSSEIERLSKLSCLEITTENGGGIRLTKYGRDVANEVMCYFT